MPRAKARRNRPKTLAEKMRENAPAVLYGLPLDKLHKKLNEFSSKLDRYYNKHNSRPDLPDDNTAASDDGKIAESSFSQEIIAIAMWAKDELHAAKERHTKQEMRAELGSLRNVIQEAIKSLKAMSFDVEDLLSGETDVIDHAERLERLEIDLKQAEEKLSLLPRKDRLATQQRNIIDEMAIRALRVASEYGFKVSYAVSKEQQPAVELLALIGGEIDHNLSEATWADIIERTIKKL